MDAIQQTIIIPASGSVSSCANHEVLHFNTTQKSSEHEKLTLIAKIKAMHNKNAEREAKQQSLQNTVLYFFIFSLMI